MLGFLVSKFYPEIVLTMFLGAHDLVARYPGSTYLAKKCDCIFTHSNANLDAISSLSINVDTVKVVFRGTKLGLESAADSSKFQYMERPILLVASRLVKEKGVDDVLRVFKVILDDYPHAVLQIAGDGAQLSALKDLALELGIDEHVIFLGHINQDLLRAKMTAAHFFVLMSCYQGERLPNAVKEAMYQKCVIITTETIGIEELVTHGADGFVVPMGDYIGASECLQLCIMDPLKALLIAENAHQKIIQSFDINVSMSSYLAIWERHLKAREFSI
jgi:glycosyltransferase involved in cell wall biosynthesis